MSDSDVEASFLRIDTAESSGQYRASLPSDRKAVSVVTKACLICDLVGGPREKCDNVDRPSRQCCGCLIKKAPSGVLGQCLEHRTRTGLVVPDATATRCRHISGMSSLGTPRAA